MSWFGIEVRNVPKKETVQKIAHLCLILFIPHLKEQCLQFSCTMYVRMYIKSYHRGHYFATQRHFKYIR